MKMKTKKSNRAYDECKRSSRSYKQQKKSYLDKVADTTFTNLSPTPSDTTLQQRFTTPDWINEFQDQLKERTQSYLLSCKFVSASSTIADKLYSRPSEEFVTGSSYSGQYNILSFSGYGRYYYPHGVIYEGEFKNGHFHGEGTLIYPNKQKIAGTWCRGKLKKLVYKYADDLEYHKDWDYLRMPDRGYQVEIAEGFAAPLDEYITPMKELTQIPHLTYDVGDEGFYDDGNKIIYSKDRKMRRIVESHEMEVITDNYRQECDKPVKYHPELYEYWSSGREDEMKIIENQWNAHRKYKPSLD